MAKNELNALALGYTGAVISSACILLLGIGWNLGVYAKAAQAMAEWHLFFGPTLVGIIGGMVEAAVWGFVTLWVFGWLYNKFV